MQECERPLSWSAHGSSKEDSFYCDTSQGWMELRRHVSFVDCPGHDILMATMLNGAAVMDGALLLIAANETCPQPQTSEHLAAVEIMKLEHLLILQNKVDLVDEATAVGQHEAIKKFVQVRLPPLSLSPKRPWFLSHAAAVERGTPTADVYNSYSEGIAP